MCLLELVDPVDQRYPTAIQNNSRATVRKLEDTWPTFTSSWTRPFNWPPLRATLSSHLSSRGLTKTVGLKGDRFWNIYSMLCLWIWHRMRNKRFNSHHLTLNLQSFESPCKQPSQVYMLSTCDASNDDLRIESSKCWRMQTKNGSK